MGTVPRDEPTRSADRRFTLLVEQCRTDLYRFLLRRSGNPDLAEEVLQESLVRAYRSLERLPAWSMARPWLFGIARHVLLDELRRQKVRSGPALEDSLAADPAESPEQRLEASKWTHHLRSEVEQLDPPKPEIIDLFYGGGLGVAEIGRLLNMPEATVKTHLHRARAALRRSLCARMEPGGGS